MRDSSMLLNQLAIWISADRQLSLDQIAREFSALTTEELLPLLQEDQRLRSEYGVLLPVEDYVQTFGDRLNSSAQLDLIYHEYILKEEAGWPGSPEEYLTRFPQFKMELGRQFELHRVLTERLRGSTAEANADKTIPDQIPRETKLPILDGFRIDAILGTGAMGIVYEATDLAIHRRVAIKMLLGGLASRPEDVQRLRNEAAAISQLRHPNIVALFQVAEYDGLPYLVMEKVDGQTLATLLRNGPLSVDESLRLIEPICDAIGFANSQKVIHRDLKPANILLNQNKIPFVTDFGLARLVSDDPHVSGNIVGTPQYMSPEQARGESISPASDVYALGVILYEMLSGRPPFQAATAWDVLSQILEQDVPKLRELNSKIPLELQTICEKCLSKDADRRYATATELKDELIRFREGRPILARPPGVASRIWKWCRRNPAVASLISLSFVLLSLLTGGALISASRLSRANIDIRNQSERAFRAESEALKDREAVVQSFNTLVDDLYQDLSTKTGTMRQRDAIIRTSLTGLQKIADRSGDRDIDANLIIALLRMGDLQTLTGNEAEATKNFDLAIAACEKLLADQPDDYEIRLHLATAWNSKGMLQYRRGNMIDSKAALQTSAEMLSVMIEEYPDEFEVLELAVSTSNVLTDIIWVSRGDHLKASSDGVLLADRLLANFPTENNTEITAATSYQRNGRALVEAGQLPAGIERYQKAQALLQTAREADPEDDNLFSTFLINRRLLANALAMSGQTQPALDAIQDVIDGMVQLSDADPASVPRAQEVVLAYVSQSLIYDSGGNIRSSYESLLKAKQESTESMILNPSTTQFSPTYCQICLQLAMAELDLNQDWQSAEVQLNDFYRIAHGEGDRPGLSETALVPYMTTLHAFEEPIRRHNRTWSKQETADGTAVLISMYALNDVRQGAMTLSDAARGMITDQCGQDTELTSFSEVFDHANSIVKEQMPKAVVLLARIVAFADVSKAAEEAADPEARSQSLNDALTSLQIFRDWQPDLFSSVVLSDSRLKWLFTTDEFQNWFKSER